jgi:gliding motility-associated-like protein
MLVVTDVNGCQDTVVRDMLVFMPPQVPNGFSPNGTGPNNAFNVLGGPFLELNFRVYNNWGQLIFESNDQALGWDGTYNGIEQPIGVYVWTVRAVTLEGQQHELSGDVTLLR